MINDNKDALAFDDAVDPVYKKGFEHGYWLQRANSPDLDALIKGAAKHEEYYSGLRSGRQEAQRELFRDEMEQIEKDLEKDKDKGMDMDY